MPASGTDGELTYGEPDFPKRDTADGGTSGQDGGSESSDTQTQVDDPDGAAEDALADAQIAAGHEMSFYALVGGGFCKGTTNTPFTAFSSDSKKGIGFSAYQDCEGDFFDQQVCVKLQERDQEGKWFARTKFRCGPMTTSGHAYAGSWVSCASAGKGVYRTRAKGTVDTPYGPMIAYGTSEKILMC